MRHRIFWFIVAGVLSAFAFAGPAFASLQHNHEWPPAAPELLTR
jgi:hypothetical protein